MSIRHAKVGPRVADRIAHLERVARNESLAASTHPAFDTRVSISFVSFRHRLADADGVSGKAAIDGLVHARIIKDDSTKYVEEVSFRQVKVKTKEEQKTQLIIKVVD